MGLDNALGDGQAQARSLGLGSEKRLKESWARLRAQTGTVIAQGDPQARPSPQARRSPCYRHDHRVRTSTERILQNVAEHVPQGHAIGIAAQVNRRRLFLELSLPASAER